MENWYQKRLSDPDGINIEAGMKENLMSGALAAIILVLGGTSIYNAALKSNVSESEISEALQDPAMIETAKRIMGQQDEVSQPPNPLQIPSSPLNLSELASMIARHEGGMLRTPYQDSRGLWTVGVGFNLEDPNAKNILAQVGIQAKIRDIISGNVQISDEDLKKLFYRNLEIAFSDARQFVSNFDELPSNVKMVLVDMSFNLGYPRLSQFDNMRSALLNKDFELAKKEMINSKWYRQVKSRGTELVKMME